VPSRLREIIFLEQAQRDAVREARQVADAVHEAVVPRLVLPIWSCDLTQYR
jgi:hypothetical protein